MRTITWRLSGIRRLSAVLAANLLLAAGGLVRGEDQPRQESIDVLSHAVSGELTDVAGALRQLDQSYVFRGMQGCGSATAGSVHIDWDAKGVPTEQRVRVLPPQPLVLSRSMKQPCQERPAAVIEPPQPAPVPESKGDEAPPATAPSTAAPCSNCGGTTAIGPVIPCPACAPNAGVHPAPRIAPPTMHYDQPAEIYYHGRLVSGGNRTPPQAMLVDGRWMEYPASSCGRNVHQPFGSHPYPAPAGYGSRIW